MSGPNETYDVSAAQRKIMLARAARRETLRRDYLQQINNPYRQATGQGGTVFDSGLQRFLSMHATSSQFFRPSTNNAMFYGCSVILPIAIVMYVMITAKDMEEHRYRTGQVSYRDREFKFQ